MRWNKNIIIGDTFNPSESDDSYVLMLKLEELAKEAGLRSFLTEIRLPASIQAMIDSKADEKEAADHIEDADGTLASATSRINAILNALETLGFVRPG